MKNQINVRIGLLVLTVISLSACSPFGNQSLIQDISSQIGVFIPGKTSTNVLSSASATMTMPETPGQAAYSVTHSVGDVYGSPVSGTASGFAPAQTVNGYQVFSSVSSDVK